MGANTFTYDGLQRLASVRQTSAVSDPPDASVTAELAETPYSYMTVVQPPSVGTPAVDTLAMSSDPMPGMEADFAYNADSQLLSADDYQSDSTAPDAAMSIHVAHAAYGYDHASELTDLMYTDGSDNILAGYHWDYNNAGLVSDEYSWLDSGDDTPQAIFEGAGSTNWGGTLYSYDHDSQLTGTSYTSHFASPPTSDVDVSYDANGNRTSTTDTGDSAVSAASSTDRVLFDGTYYYMYDAAGNRTLRYQSSDGKLDSSAYNITGYEWNDRNELTAVDFFGSYANYSDHDNPSEVDYAYDALGHLVARSPDGLSGEQTEFYVYDGQNLALVLDAGGGVVESELYNPTAVNQVFASENASGVNWYLTDNQGTVRDVVQWTGAATENVDHLVYTPYGQIAWQSHAVNQPRFTYDGMPFDNDTQLSYDQARWYDAVDAVFASQDPLGFGGGQTNTEEYAGNNPTNYFDPSGMDAVLMPWESGASWNIGTTASLWWRAGGGGMWNGVWTGETNPSPEVSQGAAEGAAQGYNQAKSFAYSGLRKVSHVPGAGLLASGTINALTLLETGHLDRTETLYFEPVGVTQAPFSGGGGVLPAQNAPPILRSGQLNPRFPPPIMRPQVGWNNDRPVADFGTPWFGTEVHQGFPQWLMNQTNTNELDWDFRVADGLTGPDANWTGEGGGEFPGFEHGELKPATDSGFDTFKQQLGNWDENGELNGPTRLFGYDENGNIFDTGQNFDGAGNLLDELGNVPGVGE